MKRKITQKKIADDLGISQQTVSFCFSRPSRVAQKTLKRVLAYADEVGYRPNSSAQALRQGLFGNVALLTGRNVGQTYLTRGFLKTAAAILKGEGMNLLVASLESEVLGTEEGIKDILRDIRADGLLVNFVIYEPKSMNELLQRFRIPAIWVNRREKRNCVYIDDFQGAYDATRHLLELGHKRIAFVNYAGGYRMLPGHMHYSMIDRNAGYTKALHEAGLMPMVIAEEERVDVLDRIEVSRRWLDRDDRPTAAIGYNFMDTVPFYEAARDLGLSVPEDLSLVTFHLTPFTNIGIDMTTVIGSDVEVSREGTSALLKRIAEPETDLDPIAIPETLHIGKTSVPPRSD